VSGGLTAKVGSASMSSSGVIGPTAGRETIKIPGNGQATIIVIGRLGYVRGSAAVVKGFLELPASANMPAGTTDTLYVAATGKPLPVECVEAISTGDVVVTFTGWGQATTVKKPVHTVPAPRSGSA
jgi:hypothetical protein